MVYAGLMTVYDWLVMVYAGAAGLWLADGSHSSWLMIVSQQGRHRLRRCQATHRFSHGHSREVATPATRRVRGGAAGGPKSGPHG